MDENDTEEFFYKYFLSIPFNFKNQIDAVYYFGIHNKLSYLAINDIITKINKPNANYYNQENTAEISGYISEISDVNVFIEYISNHNYEKSFETARKELKQLIDENVELAKKEKELLEEEYGGFGYDLIKSDSSVNMKGLLDIIYGYRSQELYSEGENWFAKCENLPKLFRKGFPNDQEMSNIKNDKGKADTIRKALIIMSFYNYFCGMKYSDNLHERAEEELVRDLDDFCEETSVRLERCGLTRMYYRNPFDWIILFCAKNRKPLDAFREILSFQFALVD